MKHSISSMALSFRPVEKIRPEGALLAQLPWLPVSSGIHIYNYSYDMCCERLVTLYLLAFTYINPIIVINAHVSSVMFNMGIGPATAMCTLNCKYSIFVLHHKLFVIEKGRKARDSENIYYWIDNTEKKPNLR